MNSGGVTTEAKSPTRLSTKDYLLTASGAYTGYAGLAQILGGTWSQEGLRVSPQSPRYRLRPSIAYGKSVVPGAEFSSTPRSWQTSFMKAARCGFREGEAMTAIVRAPRSGQFEIVPHTLIRDFRITHRALGVAIRLLSNVDGYTMTSDDPGQRARGRA